MLRCRVAIEAMIKLEKQKILCYCMSKGSAVVDKDAVNGGFVKAEC